MTIKDIDDPINRPFFFRLILDFDTADDQSPFPSVSFTPPPPPPPVLPPTLSFDRAVLEAAPGAAFI